MCQHKHQVCLLQYEVVRRRADHISLSGWYSNTDLVTVAETVQTKADHGRGPQRVQKHITKGTAILNGSSSKVKISRLAFWVEFVRMLSLWEKIRLYTRIRLYFELHSAEINGKFYPDIPTKARHSHVYHGVIHGELSTNKMYKANRSAIQVKLTTLF